MSISSLMQTGTTGMKAAQAGIATTGHNIANVNTKGYSRQRTIQETALPKPGPGPSGFIGRGVDVSRVERINDGYLEHHIRDAGRNKAEMQEKEVALNQVEDIFNEMDGEGLNRLMARFFNDFRKLANDPDSEAVRQAVRESSQAMINDIHRIRNEMTRVRQHLDSRVAGYVNEINDLGGQIKSLNLEIKRTELSGVNANDLLDRRDNLLRQLTEYADLQTHLDSENMVYVDVRGVGPLVVGPMQETFSVERTPANEDGKPSGALDVRFSGSANGLVTDLIQGGKLGGMLRVRDHSLKIAMDRLDDIAFTISRTVNQIHEQGFSRLGTSGIKYFEGH